MAALILDQGLERRIIARRRRLGIDRFDEVWDGVYIMSPPGDVEHSGVASNARSPKASHSPAKRFP